MKVKRALISVSDKTGLDKFAKGLSQLGVEIISTGGTAKEIRSLGIPVIDVGSYTGFTEMMDGRVKTLHPKIHAGLLALRDNSEHMRQLKENDILLIDMVVANLYPFEETISSPDATREEAIENIDIGGPAMLRSAAKNFQSVAVLSSPEQYEQVLQELESSDCGVSEGTLKELAAEVFARTTKYDSLIAQYLSNDTVAEEEATQEEGFPEHINIEVTKLNELRYGENPHQKAAFYKDASGSPAGITGAEQLQGKDLSFNNILDLNAASEMVKDFDEPAVCIVKHNNPCGAATASTLEEAYLDALESDRMSAFGGIMGFNKPINGHLAEVILEEADFVECIIAPEYEQEALEVFKSKKNLRVLKCSFDGYRDSGRRDLKKVCGGMLLQDADTKQLSEESIKVVTETEPDEKLMDSLIFSWKIARHVKSNAIVLCQGTKTVGIGAGQMSRVDSAIIAIRKAGEKATGSVLASDAFFPKADSIEEASKAGIQAIIQPGGSINDEEVIAACNRLSIPMVFTGVRHFKH